MSRKTNTETQKNYKSHEKQGHLKESYWIKHPELRPAKENDSKEKGSKEENKDRSSILYSTNDYKKDDYSFIIDSGASDHFTHRREWLKDFKTVSQAKYIANRESV